MKKTVIMALLLLLILAACKNETAKEVKMKIAVIETGKGTIKAELYTDKAPITTKNFIGLAGSGFYNGLTFHRVEPGFF